MNVRPAISPPKGSADIAMLKIGTSVGADSLLKKNVDSLKISDVLTEQLQLSLPFQPLCKADCKGICPTCGTDLNKGRCACEKIAKSSPFAAIKDLKTKAST